MNVIGIGFLVGVTAALAQKRIGDLVNRDAVDLAGKYSGDVTAWASPLMSNARETAETMSQFDKIPVENRRIFYDAVLKNAVEDNKDIVGAWCAFEPDALDGLDARYAGTPGTDASGRYIPYWAKDPSGKGFVSALEDYENADYFRIPYQTGKEAIVIPVVINEVSKFKV